MHSPVNVSFGRATLPILQAREVVVVGGSLALPHILDHEQRRTVEHFTNHVK